MTQQPPQLAAGAKRPVAARLAAAVGLIAVGGILAGFAVWISTRPEPAEPVRLTLLQAPPGTRAANGIDNHVAISPSGRLVAYALGGSVGTGSNLDVRNLGDLEARSLADSVRSPFFSPDGSRIGYFNTPGSFISTVAVTGGAPLQTQTAGFGGGRGASWGADGTIIFASNTPETGLVRVAAAGGEAEILTRLDTGSGETSHWYPQHLPDGQHVLFTIRRGGGNDDADIALLDLRSGEYEALISGAAYARHSPSGHIVFTSAGAVRVAPFDLETLELRGTPVSVPDEILVQPRTAVASFDISPDGTLVYLAGRAETLVNTLAWIDRDGHEEPIPGIEPRGYVYASLSPDGSRIALDIREEGSDIWIFDLERQTLQPLTFDPGQNRGAVWSPDGRRVAFSREIDGKEEVHWQAADGSGVPEALTQDSVAAMIPRDISHDGSTLFYGRTNADEIWTIPIEGPTTAGTPLIATSFQETNAAVSPDGRWLAVESNESGRQEIYVRPYPDVNAGRWQVSTDGGVRPLWRRDGGELFYLTYDGGNTTVHAVEVEADASFRPGNPRTLFSYPYTPVVAGKSVYDVSPDGSRFLVVKAVETEVSAEPARIIVVENWFTELERLAPTQ